MTGLSSEHLRKLADDLDAEAAKEKQDLAEAETKEDRDAIKARLDALEKRNMKLEPQIRARGDEPEDETEETEEDTGPKPKMRKGRKHGMVYTNPETGMGEVYSGEDEADLVPVEEQEEAA